MLPEESISQVLSDHLFVRIKFIERLMVQR